MTKIAFLGLGMMGTPMATRLLEAGHDLTVWDRTEEKTKALVDRGAAATSPVEAAAGVDVAITMLANPQVLERVVFEGGLAGALGPGQMLMDMSTVGPDAIRSVRERVPNGVIVVDSPVRGSVPEATGGKLDIFVGATDEAFERVRGILESLGTVRHVGGPGAGAAAKMVTNSALGAAISAVGEALSLGEIFGLDHTVVLDVLADSPVGPTAMAKASQHRIRGLSAEFQTEPRAQGHAARDRGGCRCGSGPEGGGRLASVAGRGGRGGSR